MNAKELRLLTEFFGGQSRQSIAAALCVPMDHDDSFAMQELNAYLYDVRMT